VHLDFHPGNVLVDGTGQVTGVIDCDAAGRGDGRLAYTTLLSDLEHGRRFIDSYQELTDEAVVRVKGRVNDVEVNRRRMFWAHMSLRQVDWSIRFRFHSRAQVDYYLEYALDGLEQHGVA
jgi:aminoglycoside phosphotransferase (APT) family kinase protein